MPTGSGDWRRLADRMDLRRAELGLNWDEVAAAGRISVATLRRVRGGATITRDNEVAIERGLRWTSGSVGSVLAGGEATPLDGGPALPMDATSRETRARVLTATPEQIVEMRQLIEDVMGAETANEFLRRALALRTPPPPGGGERSQGGQASR